MDISAGELEPVLFWKIRYPLKTSTTTTTFAPQLNSNNKLHYNEACFCDSEKFITAKSQFQPNRILLLEQFTQGKK